MSTINEQIVTPTFVQNWQNTLSALLKTGKCKIEADAKCSKSLLIYIEDDGRSHYSFNFRVKYTDDRNIDVEFLDVEKAGVHVDEHTDIIQTIVKEYVAKIHECAQLIKES